jgi:hypothetical protein
MAGKHVKNTRAIARQRVPAATNTNATVEVLLEYSNVNGVFYVVRAEMLKAGSVEFRSDICQQFS